MNWQAKAFLQKFLGHLPYGNNINYFFQRKITKNLPVSEKIFFEKISLAKFHIDNFQEFSKKGLFDNPCFYEFGAGWDLIIPITYFLNGIKQQTLVDVNKKLKFELINNTIKRFISNKGKIENIFSQIQDFPSNPEVNDLNGLRNLLGIDYHAPMDASQTSFNDEYFDFISNTSTFEHIPTPFISPIIKECFRVLNNDGIMSCVIDLQDHYSYFDGNISVYNFLKYSERDWAKYNHPIQFQNRLRASDYIHLFDEAGFEILKVEKELPDVRDKEFLNSIALDMMFSKYDYEDLSVKVLKIVLRKRTK